MISYANGDWLIDKFGNIIAGGDMLLLGGVSTPMTAGASKDEAKANARRIVACVNACAGLPTEQLESSPIGGVLNGVAGLITHRDELLAALEGAVSLLSHYGRAYGHSMSDYSEFESAEVAIAKAKGGAA